MVTCLSRRISDGFDSRIRRQINTQHIMSYNIWLVADYHFGHEGPYNKFTREDGSKLRDFSCAKDCDEFMIQEHNKLVKPEDRVYVLGDVTFHKKYLTYLHRMMGRKVLIRGNHDEESLSTYAEYFDDVRGCHQFSGVLLTHIPVHPDSLGRWGYNIHGHLHARRVMSGKQVDPRYFCVSVEHTGYKPMSLEEVKKHKPNE